MTTLQSRPWPSDSVLTPSTAFAASCTIFRSVSNPSTPAPSVHPIRPPVGPGLHRRTPTLRVAGPLYPAISTPSRTSRVPALGLFQHDRLGQLQDGVGGGASMANHHPKAVARHRHVHPVAINLAGRRHRMTCGCKQPAQGMPRPSTQPRGRHRGCRWIARGARPVLASAATASLAP